MNENIQLLFDYKHRITESLVANLTDKEIAWLFDQLKSGKKSPYLKKIIVILSLVKKDAMQEVLLEMLRDKNEKPYFRNLAATYLNKTANSALEGAYIQILEREKELSYVLRSKLLKGLSIFGSKASIELLAGMSKEHMNDAYFNLTRLILHAKLKQPLPLKVDTDLTDFEQEEDCSRTVKVEQSTGKFTDQGQFYQLKLDESGQFFSCGTSDFLVLQNQDFRFETVEFPQIIGLIGVREQGREEYASQMMMVLIPGEQNQEILIYRTDGLLAYAGLVSENGAFKAYCVKKFANDGVRISGSYEKGQLRFTEFLSNTQVTPKKRPLAFNPRSMQQLKADTHRM